MRDEEPRDSGAIVWDSGSNRFATLVFYAHAAPHTLDRPPGLPVISFSIGDCADFYFSHDRPKLARQQAKYDPVEAALSGMKKVTLRSGDVIIFGGPSRMIHHAVHGVKLRSAPPQLNLAPGRLNLTLRKM